MRRAIFLAAVRSDLIGIRDYIADQSGSISVADEFVRRLRGQCHKLAGLPGRVGRSRPEIRDDVRSAPFGNYVIFFRYADERFEIVAIIERHRDVDSRLQDDHQKI